MTFCRPVNIFDKAITTRARGRFVLFRRPQVPPGHITHLVLGYVERYPCADMRLFHDMLALIYFKIK